MRSNPIRIAGSGAVLVRAAVGCGGDDPAGTVESAAAPAAKADPGTRRRDAIPANCFHSAKRGGEERVFRRSAASAHRPIDVGQKDTPDSTHGAGGISPQRRMRAYSPGNVGAKQRYLTAPGGPHCALFARRVQEDRQ